MANVYLVFLLELYEQNALNQVLKGLYLTGLILREHLKKNLGLNMNISKLLGINRHLGIWVKLFPRE